MEGNKNKDIKEKLSELETEFKVLKKKLEEIKHSHSERINSIEKSIIPILMDFDSIKEIVKTVQLSSSDSRELLSQGKIKNLNGDHVGASLVFKKLIDLEPNNPRAFSNLSYCYEKTGFYKEAINSIDEAIDKTPNDNKKDLSKYKYHLARYLIKDYRASNNPYSLNRAIEVYNDIKHPHYIEQANCMPDYFEITNYISSDE